MQQKRNKNTGLIQSEAEEEDTVRNKGTKTLRDGHPAPTTRNHIRMTNTPTTGQSGSEGKSIRVKKRHFMARRSVHKQKLLKKCNITPSLTKQL